MTDLELKKSLLSCPGDSIKEHIDYIGMSQVELAKRLGRSVPKLNELIKGKAPITKETATKLEYVLGVASSFWLNLEHHYQDELLEIEQMQNLISFQEWVSSFPLTQMKSWGLLPNTEKKTDLVDSLLKFFRVASPVQWSKIYKDSSLAFKMEPRHTAEPEAISVWLRLGELQAEKIKIQSFDKKGLRNSLEQIQAISFKHSNSWLAELQLLCASFGLALVYTPYIDKAPIYGAARWIKNNATPLIQISNRKKDYYTFWHTFYHELGHILYHGKKDIFIDGIENIAPNEEKEKKADDFAFRMLLSKKERKELLQYPNWNKELILEFSQKIKKHHSIVAAQLLDKNTGLNSLETKVEFTKLSF